MADTIGSWAVKLSADASGLVGGLDTAEKRTGNFAGNMVQMMKSVASQANTMFASITKVNVGAQLQPLMNIASAIGSFAASAATGNVVGMASSFMSASTGLASFASHSMDAVATQERLGRQIGITAQEAAGLQIVMARSGIGAEQMNHALQAWPRQIAHLRQELDRGHGGPMVHALAQMGINAREFASANIGEQFARIAEGSQRIGNELDRATLLTGVMGHHSRDLAPIFRGSADELRGLADTAAEAGYNISAVDSAMVATTVREMRSLGTSFTAIMSNSTQSLAVAFAPIASYIGETFRMLLRESQPFFRLLAGSQVGSIRVFMAPFTGLAAIVRSSMPAVKALGEYILQFSDAVSKMWAMADPIITSLGESFRRFAESVGNPFEWLSRKIPEFAEGSIEALRALAVGAAVVLGEVANVALNTARAIQIAASLSGPIGSEIANEAGLQQITQEIQHLRDAANETRDALAGLDLTFSGIGGGGTWGEGGDADTSWSEMADQLERSNRLLGRSREEAEQIRAIERAGALGMSEEAQNRLRDAQLTRAELERGVELRRQAERAHERTRTPGERFQDQVMQAQEIFLANGDQSMFDRTMVDAANQLIRSSEKLHDAPGAVLAGTIEAQKAIAQAQRDDRRAAGDPMERIRLILEAQQRNQQQQLQVNRDMLDALRENGIPVLGE